MFARVFDKFITKALNNNALYIMGTIIGVVGIIVCISIAVSRQMLKDKKD